jgi:pyruvate/2-oxoglutarate dehydrogenase complex dihydrolipoamide acyltransferase (E2) component
MKTLFQPAASAEGGATVLSPRRRRTATRPLPAQRRHTIHFLRALRTASPVFLDTDVDMGWVLQHREQHRESGRRPPSIVTYVVAAAGAVLARRPDGNAAVGGWWNPKIVNYASVDAKLVLDRTLDGQRLVASVPLRDVDRRSLADIQRDVDRFRDTPLENLPELRGLLLLHKLPVWLGWPLFAAAVHDPRRRQKLLGTFAVSSLGNSEVNGFHAVGGTALTFNIGRVRDTPVARREASQNGRSVPGAPGFEATVSIAPVMRLNMTFDHRVIDGAAAAEVLTDVKAALESGSEMNMATPEPAAGTPVASVSSLAAVAGLET